MKRSICLLLAVIMLLCMTPQVRAAQVVETGSCGENATYTLYSDGLLVIGGGGAVNDRAFTWGDRITAVEIGDGITKLGDFVFEGSVNLTRVDLGEGLQIIGEAAFSECTALKEVVIPDSVTSLNGGRELGYAGLGAFNGCTNLEHITIGRGVSFIPYGFVHKSEKLETVIIPDNVTALDGYAFSFCPRLTYVQIPDSVTYIGSMAFVNDYSLTTVVFEGSAPEMSMAFNCSSFNLAGFYPKDDPTWAGAGALQSMSNIESLIPYTADSNGKLLPQTPDSSLLTERLRDFQAWKYPAGSTYPDAYSYIINGNFLTARGDEAFAFQLSDALYGYLPISEKRGVAFSDLSVGDILYMGDETCVITELGEDTLKAAGVDQNETVYYDRALTRAQVETAQAYRTRCGVSPYPGLTDPALEYELTDLPTAMPTTEQVYETLLSLEETYPQAMPYTSKNHFYSKTEAPSYNVGEMPVFLNMTGHGCSAFAYLASDLCFGNLPARYIPASGMEYDDLRVGDSLLAYGHQVVILEVHPDHVVVVEGNYNEMINWGRILTREEIQGNYDVYTRYPAGYPFTDIPDGAFYYRPVMWAVKQGITNGVSATTFGPGQSCNRAQVVTFLWRAAGSPEPAAAVNPFVDVEAGSFYEKAVLWAVEKGVTTGTDATHFSPGVTCNRATVVTFLYRAFESPAVENAENPFTDIPAESWYTAPVLWAVEQGVTNGLSADSFGPDQSCNRAQIVTFLYRGYTE